MGAEDAHHSSRLVFMICLHLIGLGWTAVEEARIELAGIPKEGRFTVCWHTIAPSLPCCGSGRTRTDDFLLKRQALLPTELRIHTHLPNFREVFTTAIQISKNHGTEAVEGT